MPILLEKITDKPMKANHGVKNITTCHFTSETAKSCRAPLTTKVIKVAKDKGKKVLSGFITKRDK